MKILVILIKVLALWPLKIGAFRGNTNRGSILGSGGRGGGAGSQLVQLNIGLIAPHTNFGRREYLRAINLAVTGLSKTRGQKLTFLKDYEFQVNIFLTNSNFRSLLSCSSLSESGIFLPFFYYFLFIFFFFLCDDWCSLINDYIIAGDVTFRFLEFGFRLFFLSLATFFFCAFLFLFLAVLLWGQLFIFLFYLLCNFLGFYFLLIPFFLYCFWDKSWRNATKEST